MQIHNQWQWIHYYLLLLLLSLTGEWMCVVFLFVLTMLMLIALVQSVIFHPQNQSQNHHRSGHEVVAVYPSKTIKFDGRRRDIHLFNFVFRCPVHVFNALNMVYIVDASLLSFCLLFWSYHYHYFFFLMKSIWRNAFFVSFWTPFIQRD